MGDHPLLSVRDVATQLNVSTQTIYDLCAAGKLPHRRIGVGRGAIRFTTGDVAAYLDQAARGPAARATPPVPPTPTPRAWAPARKNYHAS